MKDKDDNITALVLGLMGNPIGACYCLSGAQGLRHEYEKLLRDLSREESKVNIPAHSYCPAGFKYKGQRAVQRNSI